MGCYMKYMMEMMGSGSGDFMDMMSGSGLYCPKQCWPYIDCCPKGSESGSGDMDSGKGSGDMDSGKGSGDMYEGDCEDPKLDLEAECMDCCYMKYMMEMMGSGSGDFMKDMMSGSGDMMSGSGLYCPEKCWP